LRPNADQIVWYARMWSRLRAPGPRAPFCQKTYEAAEGATRPLEDRGRAAALIDSFPEPGSS